MPFDGVNNEAIALVEKMEQYLDSPDKWVKNYLELDGKICLYGALNKASHGNAARYRLNGLIFQDDVANRVHLAIQAEAHSRGYVSDFAGASFNNNDRTTHADILDFLAKVKMRLAVPA